MYTYSTYSRKIIKGYLQKLLGTYIAKSNNLLTSNYYFLGDKFPQELGSQLEKLKKDILETNYIYVLTKLAKLQILIKFFL